MTKQEAIQAMKEGKKVKHIYFLNKEFIWMNKAGDIMDECNNMLHDFWDFRTQDSWNINWSLY